MSRANTFIFEQYELTHNFSYSNWVNAAQKCYRQYERQIRAMFGEDDPKSKTYYSFLNTKPHTKTDECRDESNGLAQLKLLYWKKNDDDMYEPQTFYCRCLFPKDNSNKISVKWREEYDKLQYFILFFSQSEIGYIDNTDNKFGKFLAGKSAEYKDKYQSINLSDIECKRFYIFNTFLVPDDDVTKKLDFSQLKPKLSTSILLSFDKKVAKKYVCYDNGVLTNKTIKEIVKYLGIKETRSNTRNIRDYIAKNDERLKNKDRIKYYKSVLTGKKMLIFSKGLNMFKSKAELEDYITKRPAIITESDKNYRHNLMKKLKRCKNKADFDKRFTDTEKAYMLFDQLYVNIIVNLQ